MIIYGDTRQTSRFEIRLINGLALIDTCCYCFCSSFSCLRAFTKNFGEHPLINDK
jgi:hypothetical protein